MGARGILRTGEGGRLFFWCPGCAEVHVVGPSWGFNGDYDRPTFTPSVLVTGHKIVKDDNGKWTGDWERDAAGNLIPEVCHSFVRDGQIQFLGDCTHALAGQTVKLSAIETGAAD
ncbi:MAG: ammonia monooxygenase [Mesorhizobium sp.]|uniref:DUF6527 family protein n=1 Tax=Mesorhizobium sp. TaxID=1871066 RepID=UPI00121A147E|nr:DUF6527 family protein [Mesorhizobium sp.]TIT19905.1 MAG: ammonia monooxygenase [Mesorhizobium sp.]